MYKIYADNNLIYDSEIEDYKIAKGSITFEINKSGSFVFSIYPDHFYYNSFVKNKTVIKVLRSDKIIFRGRVLTDTVDYFNKKTLTCEGELGFFNDSIIRPYDFSGTPTQLFTQFVNNHNSQVDAFKKFKVGSVTVVDPNNTIARSNQGYETTLDNITTRLLQDQTGGYLYITHGSDGTEEIPTLNYYADFTHTCSQAIEFGSNLKEYTKTIQTEDLATAILPLGAEIESADPDTPNERLTIKSVNSGSDYIYNSQAVATYGFILKVVEWDDVTEASNLLRKAELYLVDAIAETVTVELNAIDLHLLDRSIESFYIGDYIRVTSEPHGIDRVMLCSKLSIDLINPDNDSVVLGDTLKAFTQSTTADLKSLGQSLNAKIESGIKASQKVARGLYETLVESDNGGKIIYLHDRPTLASSSVLIRVSTVGVEVSSDGGSHWYGLQVNGTVVANLLQANGINANWINAGTLSADRIKGGTLILGGSNNINGQAIVKSAGGNIVGRWTNEGLTIGGEWDETYRIRLNNSGEIVGYYDGSSTGKITFDACHAWTFDGSYSEYRGITLEAEDITLMSKLIDLNCDYLNISCGESSYKYGCDASIDIITDLDTEYLTGICKDLNMSSSGSSWLNLSFTYVYGWTWHTIAFTKGLMTTDYNGYGAGNSGGYNPGNSEIIDPGGEIIEDPDEIIEIIE